MRLNKPKLLAALPELHVEHRTGVALAGLTSLGIGGTTDLLLVRRHKHLPDLSACFNRKASRTDSWEVAPTCSSAMASCLG